MLFYVGRVTSSNDLALKRRHKIRILKTVSCVCCKLYNFIFGILYLDQKSFQVSSLLSGLWIFEQLVLSKCCFKILDVFTIRRTGEYFVV